MTSSTMSPTKALRGAQEHMFEQLGSPDVAFTLEGFKHPLLSQASCACANSPSPEHRQQDYERLWGYKHAVKGGIGAQG